MFKRSASGRSVATVRRSQLCSRGFALPHALAPAPLLHRVRQLGDLLARVAGVQANPDALLAERDGRVRDWAHEEPALDEVRSEQARRGRQKWDNWGRRWVKSSCCGKEGWKRDWTVGGQSRDGRQEQQRERVQVGGGLNVREFARKVSVIMLESERNLQDARRRRGPPRASRTRP